MQLAPIGISTYNRIGHLKQTIQSLKANELANESELFIFSDAPKLGDEQSVADLRQYLRTISGFKSTTIIERKSNSRTFNSRDGIRLLLEKYGKLIFLEEDVVTAQGFLPFMNQALDFYENQEQVISITGYSPPITVPGSYCYDSFFLKRFSGWGFATWAKRFNLKSFNTDSAPINKILTNKKLMAEFCQSGPDLLPLLKKEVSKKIDALDVKIMLHQFNNSLFTVYPVKSLTQNIGHDGSGQHCINTSRFHHKELWEKKSNFNFQEQISINKVIQKNNYRFRDYASARNRISRLYNRLVSGWKERFS